MNPTVMSAPPAIAATAPAMAITPVNINAGSAPIYAPMIPPPNDATNANKFICLYSPFFLSARGQSTSMYPYPPFPNVLCYIDFIIPEAVFPYAINTKKWYF